jgi:drug/metabolite transporter (DMT)-like permease
LSADRRTALAFLAIVAFGGLNAIAVHYVNRDLAPLWGATLRFGIAALVLFGLVVATGRSLPRGRAVAGSVLFGLLGFGAAFGLVHWSLRQTPPGIGQIVLATVPLLTLLFAVAVRLERLRWPSLVGALMALTGVVVMFATGSATTGPLVSLLAMFGGAACMAGANVVAKGFPRADPVAHNATAMGVGAGLLLVASLAAGEQQSLGGDVSTWLGIGYLALFGSVVVFSFFLYVIARWSASRTSYVMLLMPLVTVAAAVVLTAEPVTPSYVAGGALVILGASAGTIRWSRRPTPAPEAALQPATLTPGCA